MRQLFHRFRRDTTGLIWLSMGIFLSLSLYSYNSKDPSLNAWGDYTTIWNYCGYLGAVLADLSYQLLGVSAWVLAVLAFRAVIYTFVGNKSEINRWKGLCLGLLIMVAAGLASLYWPEARFYGGSVTSGGVLGELITGMLIKGLNYWGLNIFLWTMAIGLLVFYTEMTLAEMFEKPIALIASGVSGFKILVLALFDYGVYFTVEAKDKLMSLKDKEIPVFKKPLAVTEASGNFFPIDRGQSNLEEDVDFEEDEDKPQLTLKSFLKKKKEKSNVGKKRKVSLKKKVQRNIENWELPSLSLLGDPPVSLEQVSEKEIQSKASLLLNKLEQFNVKGTIEAVKPGPKVTMFEFKPNVNVKISKITELADDLSLALSSESVRIIAPIPGRDVVGIETSNSSGETVYLKDIIAEDEFWSDDIKIPVTLGRAADGTPKITDLRKMPHALVAGSTGSGKSVFTVSMLTAMLFKHSPKTLRLILVDPKQVDLAAFENIPHLLMPPLREAKKAISALKWAIREMEKRYRSMSKFGARDLEGFNAKVEVLEKKDIENHEEFNEALEGRGILDSYYYTPQPYIVIVVEEFGDLMVVDKGNVEQAVVRLAQMARACGIHLMLAMQSPRRDVVTGLIKTNIPGRISFKVASKMDSRIILDEAGAERLLTRGDMLYLSPGLSKPGRHHGPWLPDEEINAVMDFWRAQGEPEYDQLAMRGIQGGGGGYDFSDSPDGSPGGGSGLEEEYDERYDEILAFVSTQKKVSASLLQRRFRLGYPRAARMIETFEAEGVVGPAQGSKPRQVLISELK